MKKKNCFRFLRVFLKENFTPAFKSDKYFKSFTKVKPRKLTTRRSAEGRVVTITNLSSYVTLKLITNSQNDSIITAEKVHKFDHVTAQILHFNSTMIMRIKIVN